MKKRKIKIRENSWIARLGAKKLGYGQVAMVIGHTIHLYNAPVERFFARPSWVLHELKHVEQYERLGLIGFLWRYLLESMKHGYYNNAFEIEARAAEHDYSLLERFDLGDYRGWIQ